MTTSVYRATTPFAFTDSQGVPHVVTPGTLVTVDDEAYQGRSRYFEPVATAAARHKQVETATAEPGTPRSLSHPVRATKKTSPPPAPKVTPGLEPAS